MAEYIDREEVINLLWLFADESCCSIVSDIENLPAADVAPVRHGQWEQGDMYDFGDVCSRCNWDSPWKPCSLPYCPYCGAKMDGGDSDAAD